MKYRRRFRRENAVLKRRIHAVGYFVSVILLSLFVAGEARSMLINDGNTFTDTETGYTWMDIDVYQGQSFNSVESTISGTLFHIATTAEVTELFSDFPINQNIASIIGWTFGYNDGPTIDYISHGLFDNLVTDHIGEAYWSWTEHLSHGAGTILQSSNIYNRDSAEASIGVWVVNSSIPLPPTAWLIGIGLLGIIPISRKKKAA
jgi:hypothetical protein